jgi:hypothetical protein
MEALLKRFVDNSEQLISVFGRFPNKPTRLQENFLWQFMRRNQEYIDDFGQLQELTEGLKKEDKELLDEVAASFWMLRRMGDPTEEKLSKGNGFKVRQVALVNFDRILKDSPSKADLAYRRALSKLLYGESRTRLRLPGSSLILLSNFFNPKEMAKSVEEISKKKNKELREVVGKVAGKDLSEMRKKGSSGKNLLENLIIYYLVEEKGLRDTKSFNGGYLKFGYSNLRVHQIRRGVEAFKRVSKASPWAFLLQASK